MQSTPYDALVEGVMSHFFLELVILFERLTAIVWRQVLFGCASGRIHAKDGYFGNFCARQVI